MENGELRMENEIINDDVWPLRHPNAMTAAELFIHHPSYIYLLFK
jgi:hypothetical protein